jgi:transcriptional regulator with XRE-family HTH domain
MTRSYGGTPSSAAAILQLARLKAGLSQRALAERAGIPPTMVSAYERDKRQPTLATMTRLVEAAGFELRIQLVPQDPHDKVLAALEASRSPAERQTLDQEFGRWRAAMPV